MKWLQHVIQTEESSIHCSTLSFKLSYYTIKDWGRLTQATPNHLRWSAHWWRNSVWQADCETIFSDVGRLRHGEALMCLNKMYQSKYYFFLQSFKSTLKKLLLIKKIQPFVCSLSAAGPWVEGELCRMTFFYTTNRAWWFLNGQSQSFPANLMTP